MVTKKLEVDPNRTVYYDKTPLVLDDLASELYEARAILASAESRVVELQVREEAQRKPVLTTADMQKIGSAFLKFWNANFPTGRHTIGEVAAAMKKAQTRKRKK